MAETTTTTSHSSSGGIGLGGATFLVLLALKLVGVIDWSWWWVTAPLWIPAALVAAILAIGLPIYVWLKR
jgi:hypothetical protein